MVQLSDKVVREYQEIYRKEFGKDISFEEAREQGTNLVNFFQILMEVDIRNQRKKKLEK